MLRAVRPRPCLRGLLACWGRPGRGGSYYLERPGLALRAAQEGGLEGMLRVLRNLRDTEEEKALGRGSGMWQSGEVKHFL